MGRTRSTNRGLILLLQIMTPYIFNNNLKSYAIIQIDMTICSSHGIKTQEIKVNLTDITIIDIISLP